MHIFKPSLFSVLTDHDPNLTRFNNFDLWQLEKKLADLDLEEAEAISATRERYKRIKGALQKRVVRQGRGQQNI